MRSPSAALEDTVGEPIDVILGIVAVSIGGLVGCVAEITAIHTLIAGPPMVLLERSAQLPQWRRSAQRDAKTGLANAMHWDSRARYELAKGRVSGRQMAVMLLDLDHFKRVNDEVGHLAGDAALAAITLLLSSSVIWSAASAVRSSWFCCPRRSPPWRGRSRSGCGTRWRV